MAPERQNGESGFVRHGEIVAHLRRQIVRGDLDPGGRLPTQVALQKQFGTTPVTVQRAFNRLAAEGFIGVTSNRGSFVSEYPPHLWRYGMLFPDHPVKEWPLPWSRYYATLAAIAEEASDIGPRRIEVYYDINGHVDSEDYQRLLRDLKAGTLAGIIFPFAAHSLVRLPIMQRPGVPVVTTNCDRIPSPMIGLSGTFLDRALSWLSSRGRREVGVITMPSTPQERLHRAIEKAGMNSLPFWSQAVEPHNTSWVRHAVHAILHSDPNRIPNALVVTDDHLVEAVADALVEFGVRVPDDVLVVGHWNFPHVYTRRVPVQLLGMDNTEMIRRWVAAIDAQRRGETPPRRCVVDPVLGGHDKITGIPAIQQLPPPTASRVPKRTAPRHGRRQPVN